VTEANLNVWLEASVVSVDLSEFPIEQETLLERFREIAPILVSILTADLARSRLDDSIHEKLLPAILAKDLTYQFILHKAELEAKVMLAIIEQRTSASEIGFPEFDGLVDPDY
jgi:hypothetical protein